MQSPLPLAGKLILRSRAASSGLPLCMCPVFSGKYWSTALRHEMIQPLHCLERLHVWVAPRPKTELAVLLRDRSGISVAARRGVGGHAAARCSRHSPVTLAAVIRRWHGVRGEDLITSPQFVHRNVSRWGSLRKIGALIGGGY